MKSLTFSCLLQSCKAVYDRIIDLKIATPQIVINYGMFLEENNYFEEAFKVKRINSLRTNWNHHLKIIQSI